MICANVPHGTLHIVVINRLSPISALFVGNMYPPHTCFVALVQQLVEHAVVLYQTIQLAEVIHSTDLQVRCLSTQVLARRLSAHCFIECRAAVAACYVYGRTKRKAGRFENITTQRTQVLYHLSRWRVIDMVAVCCLRAYKLGKCKMFCQFHNQKKSRADATARPAGKLKVRIDCPPLCRRCRVHGGVVAAVDIQRSRC